MDKHSEENNTSSENLNISFISTTFNTDFTNEDVIESDNTKFELPTIIPDYFVYDFVKLKRKNTELNLECVEILSRSYYGKIMIVRPIYKKKKVHNPRYQMMKSIRKEKFETYPCLYADKSHTELKHPNLIPVISFFQTKKLNFYLMDILHETMFAKLERERRLTESKAKIYITQVIEAIGHLHLFGFGTPFVNPENIILDTEENCFLNNLGKTYQYKKSLTFEFFCLPEEYKAPEILKNEQIGIGIDWWAVGILLYELLVGSPPFISNYAPFLSELIKGYHVTFPKNLGLSDEVKDLICRLLAKNPLERLGCNGDLLEIKKHPWFKMSHFTLPRSMTLADIKGNSDKLVKKLANIQTPKSKGLDYTSSSGEYFIDFEFLLILSFI